MRALALLVLLSATPTAAASGLQIAGFAFDLPGSEDDLVIVRNPSDEAIELATYQLSDGEGTWSFPANATLGPQREAHVASDARTHLEATGRLPDFALHGMVPERTLLAADPGFGLAHAGDEVRLLGAGVLVDRAVYGEADPKGGGWQGEAINASRGTLRLFVRTNELDTDSRLDWDRLGRRIAGADVFPPVTGHPTWFLSYAAPGGSRFMVQDFIERAGNRSLRINVYQFRELGLLESLQTWRLRAPDAQLDVLLEPFPVGEGAAELSERAHVIRELRGLGARVHVSSSERYAYNHAKYMIADEQEALIQTENFVPSGIPVDGESGNRGFGVRIRNATLATSLARVFDEDFRIEPHGGQEASLDAPRFERPVVERAPAFFASRDPLAADDAGAATLVVAPHRPGPEDPILRAIEGATLRIRVAHLSMPPTWTTVDGEIIPNPYLAALRGAAARGVLVQVLLDGHFIDPADERPDNADTVLLLRADAAALPIEARLQEGSHVLHAKTMIIDDRLVLVGSMNWNDNSVLHNREVALLYEAPQAAKSFARVFDADWSDADPDPPGIPTTTAIGTLLVLLAVVRTRRR